MKMLTHWYMYFAIGNVLALREGQLFALFDKTRLHYPMLAAGIIYAVLSPETYACNSAAMIAQQMLVLLPLWHITSRADLAWMDKSPTLRLIDDSSFGLYIFHYWIGQYLLSATAMHLLPLQTLAREHPYIFPFVLFIVTFAISLLLTALIKKTKYGKAIL
ncbi:MAG: hypothetical protein HUK04_07040 [Bacteroidaceae bacterium]|nr:hypothetical protein [Bacteroidaceae bacterium]